jgi:hypothetical protein
MGYWFLSRTMSQCGAVISVLFLATKIVARPEPQGNSESMAPIEQAFFSDLRRAVFILPEITIG